jgi:NitT/TauT family transport system permease protein
MGDLIEPASGFWRDLAATLWRVGVALVIALVVGVGLGLTMGFWALAQRLLGSTVDVLRSVPVSALFPLMLLLLGLGNASKIMLVVIGAAPIVLVNTMYAVKNVSPTRKLAAKQMGAHELTVAIRVIFMSALPQILGGVRIAASLALVLVLVTEMWAGGNEGLGHRIMNSYMIYNTAETYATILVAGLIGLLINSVAFRYLDRIAGNWSGS